MIFPPKLFLILKYRPTSKTVVFFDQLFTHNKVDKGYFVICCVIFAIRANVFSPLVQRQMKQFPKPDPSEYLTI
jgi:hypothetical protein